MSLARKVAVNTSMFAAARLATAAAGVLATALSTRYLGPEAFGSLTIAIVFSPLLLLANDMELWTTTTRELSTKPEDEDRMLANVLALGACASLLALALGTGLMFALYGGGDDSLTREGILILMAPVVVASPAGVALAWFNSRQRALPLAVGGVASGTVLVVLVALVYVLDLGYWAAAAAYSIALCVNALAPLVFARGVFRRPQLDLGLWRAIVRQALPQGAVLAIGVLYFRVDTVLLSVMSSETQVALYGVAYRVVEALTVLPTYFMFTLFPEIARSEPHGERLAGLVQGAFTSMQILVLPLLFVFAGFAPEIVDVIGGAEFEGAVPVLQILIVPVALGFLNGVYVHSLVALGRQGRLAVTLTGVLAANVALNAALIPLWEARGAAAALILSELLAMALLIRAYRDVGALPRPFRLPRVLAAGAAMAPALAVKLLPDAVPPVALIALGCGLGLAAYLVALVRLRAMPPEMEGLLGPLVRWVRPPAPRAS